jgi:glycosyltransferase involved in cell wall biosynthesis
MNKIDRASSSKMRIAVVTDSISRKAGGLFWSVRELSLQAISNDCNASVFAGEDEYSYQDAASWEGIQLQVSKTAGPRFFGYQSKLVSKIKAFKPDVVHQHGLWMYPSLVSVRLRRLGVPYIISPHGMLDEWALKNSSWKKKLARFFYEDRNLLGARCIRALCVSEMHSIRSIGVKSPIAVIPNGINIPRFSDLPKPKWLLSMPTATRVVFFLGRIHPKKGLVELLRAWSSCKAEPESSSSNWVLVISGWDERGHEDELKILTAQLGITENVKFIGPSFDDEKASCLLHADAFILPSHSEGLPMAVLEAWSYSLPVVMTSECNLPDGFDADAAIHIDPQSRSVAVGLRQLFKMTDSERSEMGARGLALVKERFQWPTIGSQMNDVYLWMLGRAPAPACVAFYNDAECK